ncbi:serine hydrolase domain-containing protein [Stenotrophomonas nitritireducens]|uniref:serine hydrolase domain-containing protein n=1 Tax=Stenotrophomonas nitritireducens TaxID=83617 RepID=UPI003D963F68
MKDLVLAFALLTIAVPSPLGITASVHPLAKAPGSQRHHAEALLIRLRAQYELPALAAVVVRADTTLDLAVTGLRRQGGGKEVDQADRFHLGSMGKAITATVIARLVEEGKLSWTTRPVDVFPELAETIHSGYRDVTIEQLLRHQAGTPPYDSAAEIRGAETRAGSGSPRDQRRAFSIWLLQQRVHVMPGTRPEYSNAGYPVAAAMAEAAAGEAWESLVESRLSRPLGINLTHGLPARGDSQQPWGHKPKSAFLGMATYRNVVEPQAPGDGWALGVIFGAAGDYSLSLADYAKFLQLHLAGLAGRDGLLKASSIKRLHAGPGEYAMGWFLRGFGGTAAHWHTGSTETFFSRVVMLPERDVAVAVLTNTGSDNAAKASREATMELLKVYGQPAVR